MRTCGDCQLCCRLLPMRQRDPFATPDAKALMLTIGAARGPGIPEFDKPAGERCPHQRHHKGCAVYGRHPYGCQTWNCGWLVGKDTAELRRPDRVHYVIDIMPDFVTVPDGDGKPLNVEVTVIWADPRHKDAWRADADLMAFLDRRKKPVLVRFNSKDAAVVVPPSLAGDGQFHDVPGTSCGREYSPEEVFEGLAAARPVRFE